jgi:hypothetical protein
MMSTRFTGRFPRPYRADTRSWGSQSLHSEPPATFPVPYSQGEQHDKIVPEREHAAACDARACEHSWGILCAAIATVTAM